ncbi:hypothetical protein GCM10022248_43330 [Nonomuraea soli]
MELITKAVQRAGEGDLGHAWRLVTKAAQNERTGRELGFTIGDVARRGRAEDRLGPAGLPGAHR